MKRLNDLTVKELDERLWKVFSLYIRLRDANEDGYITCITCGQYRDWKYVDAGHGVSRKHFCTKYDERNNRSQCKPCNKWGAGERAIYAKRVDEIHGSGTWAELEQRSKGSCKKVKYYFMEKIPEYQQKIRELMKSKEFDLPKNYHTRLNWK